MSVVCYNSELVIRAVSCLADNAEAGSEAQDESLLLVADSDGFQCNVYTGSHHHSTAPPVELPH